jgi:FkbM family methyltransferase
VVGLAPFLRTAYYRLFRPDDGIVCVQLASFCVSFRVHNYSELRYFHPDYGFGGEGQLLRRWVSALHEGDVVWDIGANLGLYTVSSATAVGERGSIVAFEPDERNYLRLQENVQLNKLSNVRMVRAALGESDGTARLYMNESDPWTSTLLVQRGQGSAHETVKVLQGDRCVVSQGFSTPRAVKIDVEGYEYSVLQGLQKTLALPACELILCEVHPGLLPPGVTAQTVLGLIQPLGFARTDLDFVGGADPFHVFASKRTGSADR